MRLGFSLVHKTRPPVGLRHLSHSSRFRFATTNPSQPPIMKTLSIAAIAVVSLALLAGCSTHRPMQHAIVCPDCRTVMEEVSDPSSDYSYATTQISRHECPGCQGALATFFKEGKLQHKCSVCAQDGYSCPLIHPAPMR
jgi:hypothetical protein